MRAALAKAMALLGTDFASAKEILLNTPHEFIALNTGSWDPAVATGALNYMHLGEVQTYSQIHVSELSLNRLNRENEDVWFDVSDTTSRPRS